VTEPGDVIEIGRRIRRFQSAHLDVDYILEGSLHHVDPAVEMAAARARPAIAAATTALKELLEVLERTPAFTHRRREKLEDR
jgi:hypothetical protein